MLIGLMIGGWVNLSLGMGLRLYYCCAAATFLLFERSKIERGVKGY